jgi:hypothetical protein
MGPSPPVGIFLIIAYLFYECKVFFCDGGVFFDFLLPASTDAHPASRVRCAGMDALSLSFHKERAKERELGRSLRDLPWRAQKLSAHTPPMFLRKRANSDFALAF